jgi:hypothetical protein
MTQMGSVLTPPETAFHALTLSTPLGGEAFLAYLTLGWAWLVPLLALYLMPPFTWGRRAARWWAPGLAYGVGTWLAAPWFVAYWFRFDRNWGLEAEARLILLAVPLALLASGAGALLRRWTHPLGAFTCGFRVRVSRAGFACGFRVRVWRGDRVLTIRGVDRPPASAGSQEDVAFSPCGPPYPSAVASG